MHSSFLKLFLVFTTFGIFVFVASGKSIIAATSTDTMIGYWKFDETTQGSNAADSSGDGRTATPFGTSGGPAPSTDKPTTSFTDTRSLDFNGSNHYLEVANNSNLNGNTFTIAFWVKFDNVNSTHQTLVSKWQVGVKQQYTVQLTSANNIGFWTGNGSTVSSGALTSSLTPSSGTWYHITAVGNGTNRVLYINGTDNKYTGTGTSAGSSDIELTMGSKKNSSGTYFEFLDGKMDDVRIYNRALGDTEVDALADGDHTSATWDGSSSDDYEVAANWNINAIPDPYTQVIIANAGNQPAKLSQNTSVASMTINSGAILDLGGFTLSYNDGGSLTNNGTLYTNGVPTPTPTSTPSNSNNSSPPSTTSVHECSDTKPASAPDLFQIDTTDTQATLYFSPSSGNVNKYFIAYGYTSGDTRFGVQIQEHLSGVMSYTIGSLEPNTSYVFKVRGGNGCQPGDWSNEMKIMTTGRGLTQFIKYYKNVAPQTSLNTSNRSVLGTSEIRSSKTCEYEVKYGDSLWSIATEKLGNGNEYQSIMKGNGMSSTLIHPGKRLKVGC